MDIIEQIKKDSYMDNNFKNKLINYVIESRRENNGCFIDWSVINLVEFIENNNIEI